MNNGERYKLIGECNRCGDCCKAITDFYLSDGNGCREDKTEQLNKQELSYCQIYWNRPFWCVLYPYHPYDKLYKNCSYSWKRRA